jgi:hypothetical protein
MLQQMTAGIMETKATKAAKLTPVAGESATTVAEVAGLIPLDVPGVLLAKEGLTDVAADLRKQAAFMVAVADGLDVITGVPSAVAEDAAKTAARDAKLAEKEADRRVASGEPLVVDEAGEKTVEEFAADFAALKEAAQLSAFTTTAGWVCPEHGSASLTKLIAGKSKREYLACTECERFQKGAS